MTHKTEPLSNSTTPFSKTRQNLQKNKVCCGHKVLGRLMQEKLGYISRPIRRYYDHSNQIVYNYAQELNTPAPKLT